MTQTPQDPSNTSFGSDDTSDRLYTPEELAAYAAGQEPPPRQAATSPAPPAPDAQPAQPPLSYYDPLSDPMPGYAPPQAAAPPQAPSVQAPPVQGAPPQGPGPTGPPPAMHPGPTGPPPVALGDLTQPMQPVQPIQSAQTSPQIAPPEPPTPAPSHSLSPTPAPTEPSAPQDEAPTGGQDEGDVRRFMTATDFLDRRDESKENGPATWGWRGAVRRWTGGLIKPRMGEAEVQHEQDRSVIQRDFDGPRTIAFINPKGGAAKTTGVLAAGYTFGTVRGGGVVAWDNNETRGTLGIRGTRSTHRNTTRELLEDLEKFSDVYQSRIGDLGAFVRSQGDAHFDVLASDERPDVTGMIHAGDFNAVHQLLERFYRVILVDTGNNMRAENWLAAADAADLLVVTSTIREDTGYSGLWMLDALQDAGYQNLKYKTITVLSDPSPQVDSKLAHDLVEVYQQRTRGVYRVPYDPALVAGSAMPYPELSENTRRQWLHACAGMASAL